MSSNVVLIDVYPMKTAVMYQDGNARKIKVDLCCFLFIFSSCLKRESWSRPRRDFRPNKRDKCKTKIKNNVNNVSSAGTRRFSTMYTIGIVL